MQLGIEATNLAASDGGKGLPAPAPDGQFVINLSASTTPVALTQPSHPELKRFTFFVSRRREDGRERFRLHMGYFRSQEDAERLLDVVREFYPAAWAGVAPGQKLRNQQPSYMAAPPMALAALDPAPAPTAMAPEVASTPEPARAPVAPPLPPPAWSIAASAPHAPTVTPVQPPAVIGNAPVQASTASPVPIMPAAIRPGAPTPASMSARSAPSAASPPALQVAMPTTAEARDNAAIKTSLSSVRAAIAALDGSGPTPLLTPRKLPELQPRVSVPTLSDSQVLRVLELPKSAAAPGAAAKPRSELTSFAVQLMWSVQPIDMNQIPQLAIFNAYTLYGAEGNRDGRRWYGVRLGFFTDAVSAKQVAQYVRSEFASVSVVPVTIRERERATMAIPQADPKAASASAPAPAASGTGQFKLLDNTAERRVFEAKIHAPKAAVVAKPAKPTGKRVKVRNGTAKKADDKGTAKAIQSLEETLEILGADELQIDNGRGELINDSGVRHLRLEMEKGPKGSKLGKLINRLAERMGNG